jgi:hypothetical protein
MSFPNFDPSQGQPNQFVGDNNGTAPGQPQQPQSMQQQQMPMMQAQGMPPQQPGPNQEMVPSFQGQGGMEQGSVGSAGPGGGDSKTTLW